MNLIPAAFAEETATATSGTASSLFEYIFIAFGLYYIVCGILTLINKKIYDGTAKSYAKYTDESVQKAMPFLGSMNILIGIGFIFFAVLQLNLIPSVSNSATVKWVGAGVILAVAIAVACYMQFRVLVKKPEQNQ